MHAKSLILIALVALSVLFTSAFQSCQPMEYRTELKMTDTLHQWINEAEETMIVQESNISRRQDTIQSRLNFISENKPEISRDEQKLLTDYRAVGRAYRYYLENFELVEFDNVTHRERIENLEKDVRAGRIDKDEFRDIYQQERTVIEQHRFDARELVAPVVEVEEMYQRTKDQVYEMYLEVLSKPRASK